MLYDIRCASIAAFAPAAYSDKQVKGWLGRGGLAPEGVFTLMAKQGYGTFVAEIKGEIAGYVRYRGSYLEGIHTHPAYARQGIGRLLMEVMEENARQKNIAWVSFDAALNAVPFYETCGYKGVQETMHQFKSGARLPCLRMEKFLL